MLTPETETRPRKLGMPLLEPVVGALSDGSWESSSLESGRKGMPGVGRGARWSPGVSTSSVLSVTPSSAVSLLPTSAVASTSATPVTRSRPSGTLGRFPLMADDAAIANVSTADRKLNTIKVPSYNGSSQPLETFLAKFRNCAAYYKWGPRERFHHLVAALEGQAAAVLYEIDHDSSSEESLTDILRSRFGQAELLENFRFQLRSRRRKPGETLQELYNDICRLLALSYPGEKGSLFETLSRDCFLDALNDQELRVLVLDRRSKHF